MNKTQPTLKGECNCCIEEGILYPCEIEQCSWCICETCYKKTFTESDKCPACRNSIKYKAFTPRITPLEEVHIDINDLERGPTIGQRLNCHFCSLRTPCCIIQRDRDDECYCRCRNCDFDNICTEFLCFLFIFIFILCGLSLVILIGRWIIWILAPELSYYIFWVPWFLFILYGICGAFIAIAIICCASILLISCCKEEFNDDW